LSRPRPGSVARVRVASRPLARRYARALLDVALAGTKGEGISPENLRRELQTAVALLAGSQELMAVLSHPGVGAEGRKRVAAAVWGKTKASPLLRRLVELLVEHRRIGLLPLIEAAFGELWNARRGVVSAEAVGALPLGETETRALARALEKASGHEVELTSRVDPDVLGGILVRMGGRTYDGTVRSQLKALRESLAHGR
jgi:F-type H+-transporting ATPase subunit delta